MELDEEEGGTENGETGECMMGTLSNGNALNVSDIVTRCESDCWLQPLSQNRQCEVKQQLNNALT